MRAGGVMANMSRKPAEELLPEPEQALRGMLGLVALLPPPWYASLLPSFAT